MENQKFTSYHEDVDHSIFNIKAGDEGEVIHYTEELVVTFFPESLLCNYVTKNGNAWIAQRSPSEVYIMHDGVTQRIIDNVTQGHDEYLDPDVANGYMKLICIATKANETAKKEIAEFFARYVA